VHREGEGSDSAFQRERTGSALKHGSHRPPFAHVDGVWIDGVQEGGGTTAALLYARYRTWMSPLVTSPDAEYPAAVWITRVSAGLEPGGPLSSTAIR
jgi:hypothetical protein